MAYERVEGRCVAVEPLADRPNKHTLEEIRVDPEDRPPAIDAALGAQIRGVAERMRAARQQGAAVILAYGAHLVKNGLGPVVTRLLEDGWITHLATNGAGVIHDWEYAFQGASEEDVSSHVAAGRFGTWDETGRYTHLAVLVGALEGMGYGESLGRFICEDGCRVPERAELQQSLSAWSQRPVDDELMPARAELLQFLTRFPLQSGYCEVPHPHRSFSLTAAAYRLRVPLTVHPGIGYDIVYTHPMANGATYGRGAGIDFSVFAASVARLHGGVFLSVGSAVMGPQVFEKAMSVCNNLRRQRGHGPLQPFIAVNDLVDVEWNWGAGEPPPDHAAYYVRFCKSFSRMGGDMTYVRADNRAFLHHLHRELTGSLLETTI